MRAIQSMRRKLSMNEENQHTLRGIINPQSQYTRTSTDNWIDIGAILGYVCGVPFLFVFLATLHPVFLWLVFGLWCAAGALWWWHTFRRMAWSLQRSRDEQQRDTPATKAKRLLLGLSLLCVGVLVAVSFKSLDDWWGPFFTGPLSISLTASGVAVIVQTVRPKIKRANATE
jgi:hypothetical protein